MKTGQDLTPIVSFSNVWRAFRYWPYVFRLLWETRKSYLVCLMVLTVMQGLMPVMAVLATQELINAVVEGWEQGFSGVVIAFAFLVGVTLSSELVNLGRTYVEKLYETLIGNRVQLLIMEKSLQLSLPDFENAHVQDQLKRAQSEAGHRPFQVILQILGIINGGVTLFSAVTVLVLWKWWAAALLMLIPMFSFMSFLRLGQQEFSVFWKRAPRNRKAWYLSYLLTRDQSFKEVKLYQLGPYLLQEFREIYAGFFTEDKRLMKRRTQVTLLFQLLNLVLTGTIILLALQAAFLKEILIGNLVGLLQAIRLTETTSQSLVQGVLGLCHNNLYLEQLFAYLDHPSSELLPKNTKRELTEIETIEFRGVSFRYPGTVRYALRNVDFTVRRGESLAIVGQNGSGKSTLIKLLAQFYEPSEGEILFNGVLATEYDRDSVRRRIGVVFQDFVQYELPLRHNIGFGDIDALQDDGKLSEAIERAGLAPVVERMPHDIDTQLGKWFEDGHQLSGGQWQRIAVARAFLRQAHAYALDEPSAFLDPKAESEVFEAFRELVADRIGIYISHRYSSVRHSDRILVMEQGQVVEQGSHQELMRCDGVYAQLYRLQMSSYLQEAEQGVALSG